jgi:hypothetical protein
MAIYEVSVTRIGDGMGGGNQPVAIFRISDDGKTEPELVNPPDIVTVASLRRALDVVEDRAAVAAGDSPSAARAAKAK